MDAAKVLCALVRPLKAHTETRIYLDDSCILETYVLEMTFHDLMYFSKQRFIHPSCCRLRLAWGCSTHFSKQFSVILFTSSVALAMANSWLIWFWSCCLSSSDLLVCPLLAPLAPEPLPENPPNNAILYCSVVVLVFSAIFTLP